MSVFVDEDGSSSGLAISVHNLLSWAGPIRIRIRRDLLLFYSSLEWASKGYGWSHSRKKACIIFIEWWIGIIPLAPSGAKISSCFLFRGFVVIDNAVLILRMINEFPWIFTGKIGFVIIRLVAPRAQRVGIERSSPQQAQKCELFLMNGRSPVLLRRNEWVLVEGARGLLLSCDGLILTKSNIQRQRGGNTSVKCEANSRWKRRLPRC